MFAACTLFKNLSIHALRDQIWKNILKACDIAVSVYISDIKIILEALMSV